MAVATSTLIFAGATAASGAYSAHQQNQAGKAASRAGRDSAAAAAQNAGAEAGTLLFEAEEARRVAQLEGLKKYGEARSYRSSQQALIAATGFTYDSGTAEMLKEQTDNLAAADALAMYTDGGQKFIAGKLGSQNIIEGGTSNALQMIRSGDAQGSALQSQAIGTLLSTAVKAGSTVYGGTTRTPTPKTAIDPFPWASGNKGISD